MVKLWNLRIKRIKGIGFGVLRNLKIEAGIVAVNHLGEF